MSEEIPIVQVFMFDDGPKEIQNCSWDELRTVIDYLAGENTRLQDAFERCLRMRTITRTVYVEPRGWILTSVLLFAALLWALIVILIR